MGGGRVLVYDGPGASPRCVAAVLAALGAHVAVDTEVRTAGPAELRAPGWEAGTHALVMPGGRDLPYCAELHGAPCARIRAFVGAGGAYLGLCAGAYFASARVDFGAGTELRVAGPRELAFFAGVAAGPVYGGFAYERPSGACAAPLRFLAAPPELAAARPGGDESGAPRRGEPAATLAGRVHFEGGCRFEPLPDAGDVGGSGTVALAWYAEEEEAAFRGGVGGRGACAAVACAHGLGVAVLCGAHPELSCSAEAIDGRRREGEPESLGAELAQGALPSAQLFRLLLRSARVPVRPLPASGAGGPGSGDGGVAAGQRAEPGPWL